MKFSDVPCHEVTKRRLQQFVDSDRIPHAILIEGQSGIGKFMMARAFAQYVHCENRKDGDSCGVCPSCIQHQTFNHIDTHFIFPIIKKGSGKSSISDDYIEDYDDSSFEDFSNTTPIEVIEDTDNFIEDSLNLFADNNTISPNGYVMVEDMNKFVDSFPPHIRPKIRQMIDDNRLKFICR